MKIKSVSFLGSTSSLDQLPPPTLPEYAFSGRSNVGKSSLLNMLTGTGSAARISGKPGKTTTINHYNIDDMCLFADLPGYGFAKVSKKERQHWQHLRRGYLTKRRNLLTVFSLIDANVPPQQSDLEFMRFLGVEGIPFCIAFTKTDRMSKIRLKDALDVYLNALSEEWDPLPVHFLTSATKRAGRDEMLKYIQQTNNLFINP